MDKLIKFLVTFSIIVIIVFIATNFLITPDPAPNPEVIIPTHEKTIEEVLKRGLSDDITVIHQEDVASGKLVFYLPSGMSNVASELAVEYLENAGNDWKITHQGGSYRAGEPAAIHYSSFSNLNLSTISLYGEICAPEIQALFIINENTGTKKEAKIIEIEKTSRMSRDMRIWYVELDDRNFENILIQGIGTDGNELFVEEIKQGGYDSIQFENEYSGNTISPTVPLDYKAKLLHIIEDMKEMDPGVDSWRIVYYYEDRIILYNYAHIIACDLSNDNKGIISIIELKDLNVGHFQGEWPIHIYPSPDALYCIIGTDMKLSPRSDKGLYLCNLVEGSVTELAKNYNIGQKEITWYKAQDQKSWYVAVAGSDDEIIWDVNQAQSCSTLPANLTEVPVNFNYTSSAENIDLKLNNITGYDYTGWWKIDAKTVLGAPYKKGVSSSAELDLSDFEIIMVELGERNIITILFKIQ